MEINAPLALIAELTHRCPLRCVYCSNPLEMRARAVELKTAQWEAVFEQAAALGVQQLHLTGGEPLLRPDLGELVKAGNRAGLYLNLITSGMGLTEEKLKPLVAAGLDHVQLSFQDVDGKVGNLVSGVRSHEAKLAAAAVIAAQNVAFTVNIVVHRGNLARLPRMIEMAERLGAGKLEIAHVQYNGWAFENREALLPTQVQLDDSMKTLRAETARLAGKMRIDFVTPDYYAKYPKTCMGGWASKTLLVDPSGTAAPCHSAGIIPNLDLPNIKDHSLRWIWESSPAFQRFRGQDWMQDPCKTCPKRTEDLGGCRCQAFMITGDAAATDPVCTFSPHRKTVDAWVAHAQTSAQTTDMAPEGLIYRKGP